MSEGQTVTFEIGIADAGQRIDALVASRIPDCSRSLAAQLIRDGLIKVDGQIKKPGHRPKPGETIQGFIPPPVTIDCQPEAIPLDILYEDSSFIVINKRPGMVVHPAPGHLSGTLVNALLYHCPDLKGIGGELRPGIVHRLDKDTSGVLVIAKTAPVLADLAAQFKSRSVQKQYLALVCGIPSTANGELLACIGRHPRDRKKMAVLEKGGREAVTLWSVKHTFVENALLEVDLKTGRTHQIRVHCAYMGHPIVGDAVYGGSHFAKKHSKKIEAILKKADRQMLHARRLKLLHPETGEQMVFEASLPGDMKSLIEALTHLT